MSTSVVKWSQGLSSRMSIIIRRHINNTTFAAYMAVSFIISFHNILVQFYINVYMVLCFVCFCSVL